MSSRLPSYSEKYRLWYSEPLIAPTHVALLSCLGVLIDGRTPASPIPRQFTMTAHQNRPKSVAKQSRNRRKTVQIDRQSHRSSPSAISSFLDRDRPRESSIPSRSFQAEIHRGSARQCHRWSSRDPVRVHRWLRTSPASNKFSAISLPAIIRNYPQLWRSTYVVRVDLLERIVEAGHARACIPVRQS